MKTILIQLNSNSLGDTIAIMPCVEYFMSKNTDNVLVKSNPRYNLLFKESYPNIKFYEEGMSYDKKIELNYNFNLPLQTGFAQQLGYINWTYIRPKVDVTIKERPVKSKYVTMSIHSTSQLKYWNHPTGKNSQPLSPYWTGLVHEDSITVQLTSVKKSKIDYVVEVKDNKIFLDSETGEISSYFFIQAERKDVERVLLEYKPTI